MIMEGKPKVYESTCLLGTIKSKVKEFKSSAILIVAVKKTSEYGEILKQFPGIEESIKNDLDTEGFTLIKISDSEKIKNFFNKLKEQYDEEPLSFILMDKTGEVLDFFPGQTFNN